MRNRQQLLCKMLLKANFYFGTRQILNLNSAAEQITSTNLNSVSQHRSKVYASVLNENMC